MPKKKPQISTLKSVYLALIVLLPMYAGFAVQFVPREHHGDPSGGQGWPFIVCEQVDEAGDIGLLLINASIIFFSIYILVLLSSVLRYRYLGQAPDGSKIKKPSRKKS